MGGAWRGLADCWMSLVGGVAPQLDVDLLRFCPSWLLQFWFALELCPFDPEQRGTAYAANLKTVKNH